MTNFKTKFIEGNKNILIPTLQRDYVQGGRRDIIDNFLDNLISALSQENEKIDLNYIYGYSEFESKSFIPIDGQQRLITLWLLHLYLYAKDNKNFPVELTFESREFANDFCEQLREHLKEIVSNENISEKIMDAPWFMEGWLSNISVVNMLKTLELISKKKIEDKNYKNIQFQFLDMKEYQLDDDVYIKMNGRGRPLSYFESLKSWMDKKCPEEIKAKWQEYMDNDWMDMFWENRNKTQAHPEEIDDEQQHMFYNLLALYWLQHDDSLKDKIQSYDNKSALYEFLELKCASDEKTIFFEKIIDRLMTGKSIPLYWIEKLDLLEEGTFCFVFDSMEAVVRKEIKNFMNKMKNSDLFLDENKTNKTTLVYKLEMEKSTFVKTLPLLYCLINIPENCVTKENFTRWMCLFGKLCENSNIERDSIKNALESIKKISEHFKNSAKNDFYENLSSLNYEGLKGFNEEQLKEEQEKAKKIHEDSTWEEKILVAEKYAFFNGSIRFLFRDGDDKNDWNGFDTKWANAQKYFDKAGVKDSDKKYKSECILLGAFLSRLDFKIEEIENQYIFDNESETWRNNILLCKNTKIQKSVARILNDEIETMKNKKHPYLDKICNTDVLKFVSKEMKYARIKRQHDHLSLYGYGAWSGIFIDYKYRDDFLKKRGIELGEGNKRIGDFIFGWNIRFKYNNKFYEWYRDGEIYCMTDNWEDYSYKKNGDYKIISPKEILSN